MRWYARLSSPLLLPYFLTDQTWHPRIALDYGDDPTLCGLTRDLKYEFGPGSPS